MLLDGRAGQEPSESHLRRAVSTAYYAVFHHLLAIAALRFAGAGHERRPIYALIYRGFNHSRMKTVCKSLNMKRLPETLQKQLGVASVDQATQSFASSFIALQEARHLADHDPSAPFAASDILQLVRLAAYAIATFDGLESKSRADILALMLVNPRD